MGVSGLGFELWVAKDLEFRVWLRLSESSPAHEDGLNLLDEMIFKLGFRV